MIRGWVHTVPLSAIIYTHGGIVDVQIVANPFGDDSFTLSTQTFCPN